MKATQENQRYVLIEGQRVNLTSEQWMVWDQDINKARNEARKFHECSQTNYHYCFGDCGHCPWQVSGTRVELDLYTADGNGTISTVYNRVQNPEETYCHKEMISQIFDFVAGLDPQGKQLFHLRFYEWMTIREIAEELHLSKSDVDRRIKKLLIALRANRSNFL